MAVLGCLELVSGEEFAVQDQASAHPGAHEEADDVLVSSGRAEFVFAEDAQVHIVADEERHAELFPHGSRKIIVAPGQIRGENDHAGVLVDDAGGTGSDGIQFFTVDP